MFLRFVFLQMRMHGPLFGLQICLFCLRLPQGTYYMSANGNGSGETALMHRLPSAFAGHLYVKNPFLMY